MFYSNVLRDFVLQLDSYQQTEGQGDSQQEWLSGTHQGQQQLLTHYGRQEVFGVSEMEATAPYSAM
jgi:hypothetical protein